MIDTMPRPTGATQEPDYGALTVRIPRELLERIKELARSEERSLNFIAARLLNEAMENRRRRRQP